MFKPGAWRALGLVIALAAPGEALGQTAPSGPAERQNPTPGQVGNAGGTTPGGEGFPASIFDPSRTNLLGDAFGLRTQLGNYGISLGLSETSEVLGNVSGGLRRGVAYDGLTLMNLGLDTDKAFGWSGGIFNVSALQIHGRNLTADSLQVLQSVSGIQAARSTRLWELWFQQSFLDGRFDVKIGQQSLDQEFITSSYSGTFINTAMGWPVLPSINLYAGGPTYPLASLGIRLRARPSEAVTILAGVFDDNPPGGPFADDSQLRGGSQSGTRFNLGNGALFFAEVQFAVNPPAKEAGAEPPQGLPGTYKLGAWFDSGSFPDQRFDAAGLSLADPASTGVPRMRRRNFSIYGVADQMIWRPDPDGPQSLGVFARLMGAPNDRNLVAFGMNAGVVLKAPLPGRDNDSFGVGYGFASIGRNARLLDRDAFVLSGQPKPRRSGEHFIEVTYQFQAAPWWQVQPDFQYVFTPGGGIADPGRPGKRIGNEAVFGLRTNVTF